MYNISNQNSREIIQILFNFYNIAPNLIYLSDQNVFIRPTFC